MVVAAWVAERTAKAEAELKQAREAKPDYIAALSAELDKLDDVPRRAARHAPDGRLRVAGVALAEGRRGIARAVANAATWEG